MRTAHSGRRGPFLLTIQPIPTADLARYADQTFPVFAPQLAWASKAGHDGFAAVGGTLFGKPAALALAHGRGAGFDLLSVSVARPLRRCGYGTALLGRLEALLRERG